MTYVRFWEIDAVRGMAVCMMVLYHAAFNLYYFGTGSFGIGTYWHISIDLSKTGWVVMQKTIAILFLLTVGISLSIAARRKPFRDIAKRGLTIFFWGIGITIATLIALQEGFILFGILHLIGVSIIISYWFIGKRILTLSAGILILLGGFFVSYLPQSIWLLPIGSPPTLFMLDYYPLFPWLGIVFLGLALGESLYNPARRLSKMAFSRTAHSLQPLPRQKYASTALYTIHYGLLAGIHAVASCLSWIGRYALVIYIIHQPILLTVLWTAGLVTIH